MRPQQVRILGGQARDVEVVLALLLDSQGLKPHNSPKHCKPLQASRNHTPLITCSARAQGSGPEGGNANSVEFLTHALVQVGFRPTHARRAVIATNSERPPPTPPPSSAPLVCDVFPAAVQGVPQAIEWALSHLGDEVGCPSPTSVLTPCDLHLSWMLECLSHQR